MLIKSLLLGAALVSTPICFLDSQDPGGSQEPKRASGPAQDPRPSTTGGVKGELEAAERELQRAQRRLEEVEQQMRRMRRQLDSALDRLDEVFEPPRRERNCSPSRSRALMSHYRWLRDQGHGKRAATALDKMVDQVGDSVKRLNSVAWDLMTDKDTAGKYDEFALALAERMEKKGRQLDHRYLDTIALARFLNGDVDRAVALQRQAIERGGSSDDYRRRLRTYEAAQVAIAEAGGPTDAGAEVAAAAGSKDEDEE